MITLYTVFKFKITLIEQIRVYPLPTNQQPTNQPTNTHKNPKTKLKNNNKLTKSKRMAQNIAQNNALKE